MSDAFWIDPAKIEYRISPSADLSGTVGGDWDLERRRLFTETAKYQSMVQRYQEGADWRETVLFTDTYTRRIEKDGFIGRHKTLASVADHYHARFDRMHNEMNRHGFKLVGPGGKPHPLPTLLIGRAGEVFIGNNGNHRLALAKVLRLDRIAGRVTCRHPLSPQ